MIIAIHQPNYFPWPGYFFKINRANTFIFLDDVEYSKNSFTNRSFIIENHKKSWLTIPIKYASKKLIKKIVIADRDWKKKHLSKLKNSYKGAIYFKEVWPIIASIYDKINYTELSNINKKIIIETLKVLKIKTNTFSSSEISINEKLIGDDRLIALIKKLGGKKYLSGTGAKSYQVEKKFTDNNIELEYSSFDTSEYYQRSHAFIEGASILDMLFNVGISKTILAIK